MVDCRRPEGLLERGYCWGDMALVATSGVLEAARTRWFPEWESVINRGVVPYSPRFGVGGEVPIPAEYSLENAVTRAEAYYPQATARFAAKYGVRGIASVATLWMGVRSADRLWHGDSNLQGTTTQDTTILTQSVIGVMACIRPSRLERGFWGLLSTPFAAYGFVDGFQSLRYYQTVDSETIRPVVANVFLGLTNYAVGVSFKEGQYRKLEKDIGNIVNERADLNRGRWFMQVKRVVPRKGDTTGWVRDELPGVRVDELPPSTDPMTVRNTKFYAYDRVFKADGDAEGQFKRVGYVELHQPLNFLNKPTGLPEMTVHIYPGFDGQSRLPRLRSSLARRFGASVSAWETQLSNPYLAREGAYQRSLPRGFRVTTSVASYRWKQDAISGESFLANRPIKIVRWDNRYRPTWEEGRDSAVRRVTRYLGGTVANWRDTARDTAGILSYIRRTDRVYLGLVSHPQEPVLTGRWSGRVLSERPAPRGPLDRPKPAWWTSQWTAYAGRAEPSPAFGDWQTMPTRAEARRMDLFFSRRGANNGL